MGTSSFSTVTSVTTPASSPGAILSSSIRSNCTPCSITLSWQAPNCHGSNIIAYNIDLGEKHNLITTDDACEYKIEGLLPESVYR